MNRKILSALLIAVITLLLSITSINGNTNVTNEKQETEKLTVTVNEVTKNELNSGIIKELEVILNKSDDKQSAGFIDSMYSTLRYSMSTATISINETDIVGEAIPEDLQEEIITVKYTDSLVNCRLEPNTESEIITTVKLGGEVQTVDIVDGWYKVKIEDGVYGYIYGDYIRDTSPLEYIGEYKLTYYTDSVRCCGIAGQKTASGHVPIEGVTVAADPNIPFGTKLYIDGTIYTVQDRGGAIKGKVLDVYKDLPDEALLELGVDYADVYIYKE